MNFLAIFSMLAAFSWLSASAFVVPSATNLHHASSVSRRNMPELFAADSSEKKKKGALDESVRNKLLTESIAPWRTLRFFLYGSLGSGALIGGLVTLTGTAAILSGAKEGDINTEVCLFSWLAVC